MADLQTKSFDTLVSDQATVVQGGSSALVDFSVGAILRALVEAVAAVALWLQGLVLALLATTRASTSSGPDLDSWMADFGLTRLPAVSATGSATFSRFTATVAALLPVGMIVQTADGSQQFIVTLDTTNPAWSSSQNGYALAAGTASVSVPIAAVTPGSTANVVAGAISTIAQAIAGIDTVTNGAALVNGKDAESDIALRARFITFLGSLSKATKAAVAYAIASLQQGLTYALVENQDYNGNAKPGYFYVIVNDGTGSLSSATLTAVSSAIEAVRPLCSSFGVFAPTTIAANVGMSITTAAGYNHVAVAAAVTTALNSYISALPLGGMLAWSRLIAVAYSVAGVTDVMAVMLNGGAADLNATAKQVIVPGMISVA